MVADAPSLWPPLLASWQDHPPKLISDQHFVGAKAVGLLMLPSAWVPRFIILTSAFYDLFREQNDAAKAFQALPQPQRELLDAFLAAVPSRGGPGRSEPARVLVRSNAPDERLEDRGSHRSYTVPATIAAVAEATTTILGSAQAPMCVLLQVAVEPGLLGHMSNERRVTSNRQRWLIEGLYRGDSLHQQYVSARAGRGSGDGELLARNEDEVIRQLRRVAHALLRVGRGQYHCEWVWDGRRVWLVQCDDAAAALSSPLANDYLTAKEHRPARFEPRSRLRHFRDVPAGNWSKLERPKVFDGLGLPTADVYLIAGQHWMDREAERADLIDDLARMCQEPVVIRCDLAKDVRSEDTLLPMSNASTNLHELTTFMDEVASSFIEQALNGEQWAFLPARLVPARASAMVHAFPKAQRVHVDALWGYPDGLLHYAHDSWFHYPGDNRVNQHIRYKGLCLLPEGAGWIARPVGPPLDWQPVLNEEEVRTLADWGLRLASKLGSEVQLMVLARIGGERGPEACLPWHYTVFEIPSYAESLRAPTGLAGVEVIRDNPDLVRLRERGASRSIRGYRVHPETTLLRNEQFLRSVAAVAAAHGKPIYFEGSVLGHAYYIMAREGASVVPVSEEPREDPKVYHKLVRDQIPMIIRQAGGLARVRRLPRSEATAMLAQKLIEESFELRNAPAQEITEELADILDVIEALRNYSGIPEDELERIRMAKRSQRGGFEELVYLEETSIRTLRIPAEPGGLPLLGEEPLLPLHRAAMQPPINVEPLRDSQELLSFNISLVPPASNADARASLQLRVPNVPATGRHILAHGESVSLGGGGPLKLEVTYKGTRAIIRLLRPQPVGPSAQLTLPLGDESITPAAGPTPTDEGHTRLMAGLEG